MTKLGRIALATLAGGGLLLCACHAGENSGSGGTTGKGGPGTGGATGVGGRPGSGGASPSAGGAGGSLSAAGGATTQGGATGMAGGSTGTGGSVVAGGIASVVLKFDRSTITADGKDLAYIEADIVDANGVLVPQASNTIDFSVSGAGTLVGVDNGNAISLESYKGNSRSAFSGKALAIVQSATSPGTITVKATSGTGATGLKSAAVTVDASRTGNP